MTRDKKKWDAWEMENDFLAQEDADRSYYQDEVIPKLEKKAREEMAKCPHDKFFIYCSTCKHIIGSETNDPFEALRQHREKHL